MFPQKKTGSYINPQAGNTKRNLWQVFLWLVGYYKDPASLELPPSDFVFPFYTNENKSDNQAAGQVQWIGHSTFLVMCEGVTVLTDPMFSERASPFSFMGPKRHCKPAIVLEALPSIDYVLISHNHYDHLDLKTCLRLYQINPNIKFIVALGLKKWFIKHGIAAVEELNWWQKKQTKSFCVTAVPSQHFSGRSILDRDKTLWCGFVVEIANKCVYYSGDTGYNNHYFQEIQKNFKKIDLSLIPIGAYAPREFMKPVHVNPQEALQIHVDVKSIFSLGCHYATFKLADEPLSRPPYDLYLAKKNRDDCQTFHLVEPGRVIYW